MLTHKIFNLGSDTKKAWTPPPANVVRIDVDGFVRYQQQATCGVS